MRPVCPVCGSAACSITKRSDKLYATCVNCGHTGLKRSFVQRVNAEDFDARGEYLSPGSRWIRAERVE